MMGRIKTTLVKRNVEDLIKEHGDKFKDDFESNKTIVEEFLQIASKKLRNIIAGAVTRSIKKQKL